MGILNYLEKFRHNKKILYIVVFVLFIFLRVVGIKGDMLNTDAERWHRRSENFLEGLKQHNFKETYQRYHPGVTLMWSNAFVKYISFKYQLTYTDTPLTLENADYFVNIHAISKVFNVFLFLILFAFQVVFLRKLFNDKVALIYGFLFSVEPYMIGINRWFHQTSFEVLFGFTAILALLLWYKESKVKYIILSAFFLAFSVLAKVTSLILGPIMLVVFVAKIIKDYKEYLNNHHKKEATKKNNYKIFASAFGQNALIGIGYLLFLAIFIFIFFPALWVDPLYVWNEMYGSIFSAVTDNVRADMLSGVLYYLYYPVILVFKLSPITLLLLILSLWGLRKSKDFNVFIFVFSLLNYYVFLTITEQKIDRYALIFFPFILAIVSSYIATISFKFKVISLIFPFIFLLFVIYKYHPVYSAYYSPLVGGTKQALKLGVYDNSGEYFSQAALYLNSYGRDVYTYVPDGFSSFNLLYKGKIQRDRSDYTNYVIRSYDMQRLDVEDIKCKRLVNSFGPKNTTPIVYIWGCD